MHCQLEINKIKFLGNWLKLFEPCFMALISNDTMTDKDKEYMFKSQACTL